MAVTAPQPANTLDSYWLPFTANRAFRARPRIVTRADGLEYLTDDGRRVLDATSGLYCVNAGHCRAPITAAIREAAGRLDYAPAFNFAHPQVFELTSRLALMAPGDLDHVFLATSGSEAVDSAMKIALAVHRARGEGQRTRFIGRERGYHGAGFGGMSVGGITNNRKAFAGALLPGVDHLGTTYNRDKQAFSVGEPEWGVELADELQRILALHDPSTIAGVVIEPVAGSTGCLAPPKGYLKRIREITDAAGVLLIFDEVITAFGRMGAAFAAERWSVVPDILAFAKGVTNGAVPLAGCIVRAGLHEALMSGPEHIIELFHGYTYSGHPLGVAAALAALELYAAEDLFARARRHEAEFAAAMMSLRESPRVLDIRPIGLMCGIDVEPMPGLTGKRGLEITERAFFEHDLYVRVAGDTIVVAPPLIAGPADFERMRDKLAGVLAALA